MAPFTRAAKAAAAATMCLLLDLSHDEVSIVMHELCDPLQPLLAVHLSSTAKGLREAMEEQLVELKQQRQRATALAALCKLSCAQLRGATRLWLGAVHTGCLTLDHYRTLGTLLRCRSLPRLQELVIDGCNNGDEGVALLAAGLGRSGLPSLSTLIIECAEIGPRGATALAAALTKRAVPLLDLVSFDQNPIGDVGMASLAPALRQLPELETLDLSNNELTDEGLAALLASPTEGVLPSLKVLYLRNNRITDEGCAKLASALRGGALPALRELWSLWLRLDGNPASGDAQDEAELVGVKTC